MKQEPILPQASHSTSPQVDVPHGDAPQVPPIDTTAQAAPQGLPLLLLRATLLGSYLLAFLYVCSFLFAPYKTHGYWELAFVVCFLLAGELLARALAKSKRRLCPSAILPAEELPDRWSLATPSAAPAAPLPYPKEATFWAICALGIGIAFALQTYFIDARPAFWQWNDRYSRGTILIYASAVLHGMAAYWVVCRFGWLCRGKTGGWLVADVCNALIFFPFGSFFLRLKLFWQGVCRLCKQRFTTKLEKKPAVTTIIILGVFAFFFVAALDLLRASDAIFADFLSQFCISFSLTFSSEWYEFWMKFFISLPVGAYFFGLLARCMQRKQTPSALESALATPLQAGEKLRVVSPRTLAAALCCFIGLYLLYFGVQAEYYLSAFWGDLPARVTFSEYARQGFFELCKLMALNFALLFCAAKVSKTPLRQAKALRAAAYALLAASLLFAATAMAKLLLYIRVYGFTDLRLLSAWAILVLVVAAVLAIQTIRKAQPVAAKIIYFAAASFTLLCLLAA